MLDQHQQPQVLAKGTQYAAHEQRIQRRSLQDRTKAITVDQIEARQQIAQAVVRDERRRAERERQPHEQSNRQYCDQQSRVAENRHPRWSARAFGVSLRPGRRCRHRSVGRAGPAH